jgi:hypothetical protein
MLLQLAAPASQEFLGAPNHSSGPTFSINGEAVNSAVNIELFEKANGKVAFRQSERGQIIVEYVLILMVVVAIAAILTKSMIGRDEADPGFVIKAWDQILRDIGSDHADDVDR